MTRRSLHLIVLGNVVAVCLAMGSPARSQDTRHTGASSVVEQMRGMSMTAQAGGRMTERERRRRAIAKELHDLCAAAIPAVLRALTDPDVQMRQNAALVLLDLGGGHTPEARPALDTRAALPGLILATADADSGVRAWAAHAIAEMGKAGQPAIPALLMLLRDPNDGPRISGCIALGRIGPAAVEALPALRQAAQKDPSSDVRAFAQRAISQIDQK